MRRTTLRLTVIPPPLHGTAAVFVAADGFKGPFFQGGGSIDLLCGECLHRLAQGLHSGQVENLVLQCPGCNAHNAVVSIPALETFVTQLQSLPGATEKLTELKTALQEAQENQSPQTEVIALVEQLVPDLTAIKELLVPKGPGDFYGLLGFVVAFLAWMQSRKAAKQQPSVIINNYFAAHDPFKNAKANDRCPCGSGKKYKKCHG